MAIKNDLLNVQASDRGGLTDNAKIVIDVLDVNDNTPRIAMVSSSVSEDNATPRTIIAVKI